MASKKVEDGIREYLSSLTAKPGRTRKAKVVDREAVRALRAQVKQASDPIQKAKLLTALEEERQGREPEPESDNEGAKAVFVAEARTWAEAEGVRT